MSGAVKLPTPPSDPSQPVVLSGLTVRLVPLERAHRDGLVQAVSDGELWRLWYTSAPTPDGMAAEIDRRLALQAAGTMAPYTVIDAARDRIAGMTSFMHIDRAGPRLEIGSTWYARSVQRTGLNTEAKLLLLGHAFESLGCLAVELRAHALNQQSRRAIERLGAKLDGVLRRHQRLADGSFRDTCVYSIVADEWPAVRNHLWWQLEKPR
jgi:glucosamine--fructose-6-phosphate aminotransferase (isomerizing)